MKKSKKWKPPKMKHGKFTKWKWLPYYPENIEIGENVDIGALCFLQGKFGITIEDNVQIGGGTFIYSHNSINNTKGSICIGENSTIGAHSVILPGVIIPANWHIKANSILTEKDNKWLKI